MPLRPLLLQARRAAGGVSKLATPSGAGPASRPTCACQSAGSTGARARWSVVWAAAHIGAEAVCVADLYLGLLDALRRGQPPRHRIDGDGDCLGVGVRRGALPVAQIGDLYFRQRGRIGWRSNLHLEHRHVAEVACRRGAQPPTGLEFVVERAAARRRSDIHGSDPIGDRGRGALHIKQRRVEAERVERVAARQDLAWRRGATG